MVIKKLVKMTVLKLLFKVRKMLSVKTEKVSVRPKLNEYQNWTNKLLSISSSQRKLKIKRSVLMMV